VRLTFEPHTGTRKIERLSSLSPAHLQGILAAGDEIVELNGRTYDSEGLKKELERTDNTFGATVLVTVGVCFSLLLLYLSIDSSFAWLHSIHFLFTN